MLSTFAGSMTVLCGWRERDAAIPGLEFRKGATVNISALSGSDLAVDAAGWVHGVRRMPSPHADERPGGARVSLIVIHGVSLPPGEFGGAWVEDFFTGRLDCAAHPYFSEIAALRVAPHFYVTREGRLTQFVSTDRRAWHAGRSSWRGQVECNDFSVGIELEGTDETPYADAQYAALAPLIAALLRRYPDIGEHGLAGHGDIAPGRKTDPGPAFDWTRLRGRLARGGYNFAGEPTKNSRGDTA